jgi:two-component system sensor histidine kinase DctS
LGIISQGTEHTGVEVQFQHRNGRRVDVLIHEAPLTTASGEHIGWMSSILDISERKRAQQVAEVQQQKLEASGRLVAMGEVASTLAHELNQPLGALSSFANGLVNRLHSHSITLDEVVPVVERMAKLSERAGNIIQRVNAFARRRELSRQMLDLSAFIKRVTAASASAPGVTLLPLPDEGRLWVLADSLLLEHVVLNLVANALDWAAKGQATEPQVRLWLDMDHAQHTASFNVADSGPGVPEDDRERIFSAFFSTKDGGMGMGLAICRSIVEAHHGRIDVIRDPDLGGARFVIWLPLTTPPADASSQPDAATAPHA